MEDCGVVAKGHGATNNLAEYTAVTKALEWALDAVPLGEKVDVRTDSQLVVNQVNSDWQVRSESIWPLCNRARLALARLRRGHKVTLEWVPRERNAEADRLTRIAYAEADEEGAAARAERANAVVGLVRATERPERWKVLSSSGRGFYYVDMEEGRQACSCPDFARRRAKCKHIIAVEKVMSEGQRQDV